MNSGVVEKECTGRTTEHLFNEDPPIEPCLLYQILALPRLRDNNITVRETACGDGLRMRSVTISFHPIGVVTNN